MSNILDRQTFVFSINMNLLTNTSKIQSAIQLRFVADEMILKSISYKVRAATADTDNMVQIWCNMINDNLMVAFPNNSSYIQAMDLHFRVNNVCQTGSIEFQFQQTALGAPLYYNPQNGIVTAGVSQTNGILCFTIEFVKYVK